MITTELPLSEAEADIPVKTQETYVFSRLAEIQPASFKIVWYAEYYDGPLNGLATIVGRDSPVWFQMVEERHYQFNLDTAETSSHDGDVEHLRVRRMALVELRPDQLAGVQREHELFQECVGRHTDFVDGKRRPGNTQPSTKWDAFYKRPEGERYKLDLRDSIVVGYVDW